MRSLIDGETKIAVSSSLDKASGKRNLTDGNTDTCWSSGTPKQGAPATVSLAFPATVVPHTLHLVFQGGFVARKTAVYYATADNDWQLATHIFPDDVNRIQSFDLPQQPIRALKLVFHDGSDFFGRITLYDLQLHGIDSTD